MSAIADIRRIASNYIVDGDVGAKGPGAQFAQPDGILSSTEIVNGIARLGRLLEGAKSGQGLPPERYERMIGQLREILPEARKAEAQGEPGFRYMGESFYANDWAKGSLDPDAITPLDVMDALCGDINYGNNDGEVSSREFRASSWYRHHW